MCLAIDISKLAKGALGLGDRLTAIGGRDAQARNAAPAVWFLHFYFAAAYALSGCSGPARDALGVVKGLEGDALEGSVAHLAGCLAPAPEIRTRFEAIFRAGLSARD
jgi:hypothetical protein